MKMVDATPSVPNASVKSYWANANALPPNFSCGEVMLVRGNTLSTAGAGLQDQIRLPVQRNHPSRYSGSPLLTRQGRGR